jgi:hypothetical protein
MVMQLPLVVGGRRPPLTVLIVRKGERENHTAVNQRDSV